MSEQKGLRRKKIIMTLRKRIKINIHSDTLSQLDYYRKETNSSRSSIIEHLIRVWVKQKEYEDLEEVGIATNDDDIDIVYEECCDIPF